MLNHFQAHLVSSQVAPHLAVVQSWMAAAVVAAAPRPVLCTQQASPWVEQGPWVVEQGPWVVVEHLWVVAVGPWVAEDGNQVLSISSGQITQVSHFFMMYVRACLFLMAEQGLRQWKKTLHINGFMQAMELLQSWTKPSTCNIFSYWLRPCSAIDYKTGPVHAIWLYCK